MRRSGKNYCVSWDLLEETLQRTTQDVEDRERGVLGPIGLNHRAWIHKCSSQKIENQHTISIFYSDFYLEWFIKKMTTHWLAC